MQAWYLKWVIAFGVVILLLASTFWVAHAQSDNARWVNVSSIWGLFVGLIGFSVTIYTLFETQRVTREAQQAIENAARHAETAVRQAQEQLRQTVERIRQQSRESDRALLLTWMRDVRQAVTDAQWGRALILVRECPALAVRLGEDPNLRLTDARQLRTRADDLRLLADTLENIVAGNQPASLTDEQRRPIRLVIALLEQIAARTHHSALEVPDASNQ